MVYVQFCCQQVQQLFRLSWAILDVPFEGVNSRGGIPLSGCPFVDCGKKWSPVSLSIQLRQPDDEVLEMFKIFCDVAFLSGYGQVILGLEGGFFRIELCMEYRHEFGNWCRFVRFAE